METQNKFLNYLMPSLFLILIAGLVSWMATHHSTDQGLPSSAPIQNQVIVSQEFESDIPTVHPGETVRVPLQVDTVHPAANWSIVNSKGEGVSSNSSPRGFRYQMGEGEQSVYVPKSFKRFGRYALNVNGSRGIFDIVKK